MCDYYSTKLLVNGEGTGSDTPTVQLPTHKNSDFTMKMKVCFFVHIKCVYSLMCFVYVIIWMGICVTMCMCVCVYVCVNGKWIYTYIALF